MNSEIERNIERVSEILRKISDQSEYYGDGFIKLVLLKKKDEYQVNSGIISLLQKGETIMEETRDYGDFILITELFHIDQLNNLLKELGEKQSINLKNGLSLDAKGRFQRYSFVPSHTRYGYLHSTWPRGYVEYSLDNRDFPIPNEPLAKPGLPLYPDGRKAIADFLELITPNPMNSIIIQIPDYRLRITNLIISEKSVRLNIDSKIKTDNLIAKFYADFEERSTIISQRFYSMHSPDLNFKGNDVEFSFDEEFTYVWGSVLERETGYILDSLGYSFGWGPREGVIIDYQELEIREIIRRGENLHVEFKVEMGDMKKEFLETVVAFSNTEGGMIFIGVDNNTNIIGSHETDIESRLTNRLLDTCEPEIIPIFETIELEGNKITIVKIKEGDNKPYNVKQRGIFVRRGSSDRIATRFELDAFYKRDNIRFV